MNTVLLILGVLGSGAVIIAAYVFMVAARNYVSEADGGEAHTATPSARPLVERSPRDRRQKKRFDFPMTVNGVLIPMERRVAPERRAAMA